jgi:hypothetical protein
MCVTLVSPEFVRSVKLSSSLLLPPAKRMTYSMYTSHITSAILQSQWPASDSKIAERARTSVHQHSVVLYFDNWAASGHDGRERSKLDSASLSCISSKTLDSDSGARRGGVKAARLPLACISGAVTFRRQPSCSIRGVMTMKVMNCATNLRRAASAAGSSPFTSRLGRLKVSAHPGVAAQASDAP